MLPYSQSFKRNLGLASLAILASLLSSPDAFSMEVEEPTGKSLKLRDHPVTDEIAPQKKQHDELPLSVKYTPKALQGLIDQAKDNDEAAQEILSELFYEDMLRRPVITSETINFLGWRSI